MKKGAYLGLLLLIISSFSFAQERTITGKVTDSDNSDPLIGVLVTTKGFNAGAVTDENGKYSIAVPEGAEILVFTYTGYAPIEKEIGSSNEINVGLKVDVVGLEEMVVVGYLPQKRKDLTGAVSSVSGESLEDVKGLDVQTALQGRASGVMIQKTNGAPGSGVNVRVRGSTSIGAGNQPLFVVDGVPVVNGDFSQEGMGGQGTNSLMDLNPNDIESIEVLKDAATAAIYGSRAANGVVLITTKKGRAGSTKINFNVSQGWQNPIKLIEMMDSAQYRDFLEETYGSRTVGAAAKMKGNTRWQDEIFQTAPIKDYGINFSGGDSKTRFYTSFNYSDEEGIIKGSGLEKYSGRLNLDHFASEKLALGANFGYTNTLQDRVRSDNNIYGTFPVSILWPSTVPVYNEDGTFGNAWGWENPVANTLHYKNQVNSNRIIGNINVKYNIFKELAFKVSTGVDGMMFREEIQEPSILQSSSAGRVAVGETRNLRYLNEYTLTLNKQFGKSSLVAVAGGSYQQDRLDQEFAEKTNFPTDDFRGLTSGSELTTISGGLSAHAIQSYFGNANLSIDNKYIFTGTARYDGSSRFVNKKFGFFPGVSAAWRLSSEEFLKGKGFDDLKVRLGWGRTGNNGVGNYTTRQLYGGGQNYEDVPGIKPTQLGNPDLEWEKTSQFSAGIDFAILDSKLSGSIDYYNKYTKDLLLDRPIPTTTGFSTVPENIGEVKNSGIELTLSSVNFNTPSFKWTTDFNVGFNKNEVVKLYNGIPIDIGFATRIAEGQPIGSFFGWQTDGVFQNQDEIDGHATQPNAAPGDYRFKDLSGGAGPDGIVGTADDLAPDGVINDADRTFLGSGIPKYTGGLTNIFKFKGFELNSFFQYAFGHQIFNYTNAYGAGLNSALFNNFERAWLGRWQKEGDDADYPRAVANDPNNNRRDSDRFVESGNYVRLKALTLSFNVPQDLSLMQRAGIRKARVYLTGQNILTFTKYTGFDPEVSTSGVGNVRVGEDFLTYPQPKAIIVGLNLGF